MKKVSLNGEWQILERPLSDDTDAVQAVLAAQAGLTGQVPGDVNDSLVKAGRLPEPLVGTNFEKFQWVEDRSWWFRKTFDAPEAWREAAAVHLSLEGLDVHGDVWLNGRHLGHHASAFYPFECDAKEALAFGGRNTLLVRLTTGKERIPSPSVFPLMDGVPTEAGRGYPERGERGRVFLRKPAYVWGWDWSPRLPTCGITGGAELRIAGKTEIRDVALVSRLDGATAVVAATVEIEHLTALASARGSISVRLTGEDGRTFFTERRDVFISSGVNRIDMEITIPQVRLWWPNGSGGQHLYTVTAQAVVDGTPLESASFKYGVRTVRLDTTPGRFAFVVNGRPIFMQGANWVPCDALYGRITAEKVIRLTEEAANAHFNVLRIWGGGRFEMDAFYEACDRLGVFVWQDFMSACAPLPAHEAWFRNEFRNEAEHQVRRLRNHPCLLLWCGNNEAGQVQAWDALRDRREPGWDLYYRLLPGVVRALAPHIPYWPTSPYGGRGGVDDATEGDNHHWVVMLPDSKYWSWPEYWDAPDMPLFVSEYGCGGPCCLETTKEYMGTDAPDLFSVTGRQHTNTFYDIPRVNFSVREHYCDTDEIGIQDYLRLGGLCQGLNLGYSLESLRANGRTLGGIFWMYTDAWGENGWAVVDYYLRRKISYYAVKRCLAPRRLVLRRGGGAFGGSRDEVVLLALNDRGVPLAGGVQFGYLSYDGRAHDLKRIELSLEPRSRALAARCGVPAEDLRRQGTVVAIPDDGLPLEPVAWRHCKFREAGIPPATVAVDKTEVLGEDLLVTVSSRTFAHAVQFDIPAHYRLSDHYFDLLPGEARTVRIEGGREISAAALSVREVALPTGANHHA